MNKLLITTAGLLASTSVFADTWEPVTGADNLRQLFDNTTVVRNLKDLSLIHI